jgi:DNA-binding NarL/FixJ family response regulator
VTTRVFLADDHGVVRAGLERLITANPEYTVVGTAASGPDLLEKLEHSSADVLVLDLTMPGAPFPGLLHDVRRRYPDMQVLLLSMQPEQQFAIRALREGAGGFLSKERSPEELLTALGTVADRRSYLSPELSEHLATAVASGQEPIMSDTLSQREREVLRLIGAAVTVGEIATHLKLSPKTVSTYRARILKKLGLRNTAQLMRYALLHHIA